MKLIKLVFVSSIMWFGLTTLNAQEITPVVTTLAGSGSAGSANGTGTAASFNGPSGVAVDGSGNVYVADDSNHLIRKISFPMSVTVLEPNGGEQWNEDAPHPVRWTTTDSINVTNVKIEYSIDNGSSYNTITDSTENNGSYYWNISRDPGSNHKARITVSDESGNTASDESDAVFTVHDVDTYVAEAGELRMTIRNDGWTGSRTNIAAGEPYMEYPAGSEHYHLYNSKLMIAYTRAVTDTFGTYSYDDDYAPASSMIVQEKGSHVHLTSTYTYKWNSDLKVHQRVLVPKSSGDFVIYVYTIENTFGVQTISDLYVGCFNDFDVNGWASNMAGFDSSNNLAYIYDNADDGFTSYAGVAMLNKTPVFHRWTSGTDPRKGGPVYSLMSNGTNDNTSGDAEGDYRVMLNTPKISLAPGEKDSLVVALLTGEGLSGVQSAAKSAAEFWADHIPPSPFDLVYPYDDTTVVLTRDNFLDTLYFAWNQSVDTGGDEVTYRRELTGNLQEYIRFIVPSDEETTTNMYKIPYHHIEHYMHTGGYEVISGTWTIIATDGKYDVYAENGPFTLTIDGSKLEISDSDLIPETFALHANYPNPFNPTTTISYDLPEQAQVTLGIYDLLGKQLKTLVNQSQDAGSKTAVWDGTDGLGRSVSAGVYLYQIQAGEFSQTRKMVLLK